jgi:hypothetical protein
MNIKRDVVVVQRLLNLAAASRWKRMAGPVA